MTLQDSVSLWLIAHPGKTFNDWFDFTVDTNALLDRNALWEYLYIEHIDMTVIDSNSGAFHERVKNFFDIHRWNIDKLVETMNVEYDPMHDYEWHQKRRTDREQSVETVGNRNQSDVYEEQLADVWENSGTTSGTDVHLVSAYNDNESPSGEPSRYIDTEQYRDTHSTSHNDQGTDDREILSTRGIKEDTNKDEELVEGIDDSIRREGLKNNTFQDLIEKERKVAEFNIYKWIAKHFCLECCVAIW